MKTSDIHDRPILEFLAMRKGQLLTFGAGHSMTSVGGSMPKETPAKLQLSKMRKLIERGLVSGCACGCRGDFEITGLGLELIGRP